MIVNHEPNGGESGSAPLFQTWFRDVYELKGPCYRNPHLNLSILVILVILKPSDEFENKKITRSTQFVIISGKN